LLTAEKRLLSANTKKRTSASRKKREQKEDLSRLLEVKDVLAVLATQSGKSFVLQPDLPSW